VLLLIAALLSAQAQTPIFRAGVDIVPIVVAVGRKDTPYLELTSDDFTIMLDKKPYAPVEVAVDRGKPGCYFVNFKPPAASLDGKRHRIELKVRNRRTPKWTMAQWKIRLLSSWETGHAAPPGWIPPNDLLGPFAC